MRCVCTSWYQANARLTRAVLLLAGARAAARVGAGHLQPALDPRHARPHPGEPSPPRARACAHLRRRLQLLACEIGIDTGWRCPRCAGKARRPCAALSSRCSRANACAPPSPPVPSDLQRRDASPTLVLGPLLREKALLRAAGDGCARVCVTPPPRPSPRAALPPPSLLLHSQPLTPQWPRTGDQLGRHGEDLASHFLQRIACRS